MIPGGGISGASGFEGAISMPVETVEAAPVIHEALQDSLPTADDLESIRIAEADEVYVASLELALPNSAVLEEQKSEVANAKSERLKIQAKLSGVFIKRRAVEGVASIAKALNLKKMEFNAVRSSIEGDKAVATLRIAETTQMKRASDARFFLEINTPGITEDQAQAIMNEKQSKDMLWDARYRAHTQYALESAMLLGDNEAINEIMTVDEVSSVDAEETRQRNEAANIRAGSLIGAYKGAAVNQQRYGGAQDSIQRYGNEGSRSARRLRVSSNEKVIDTSGNVTRSRRGTPASRGMQLNAVPARG